MEKKIYYNSSLPRAGSTLLSNIIAQNPSFYCTPTSGVSDYVLNARDVYINSQAVKAQDASVMETAFFGYINSGMQGYFNSITEKTNILDKSREWAINYNLLSKIQDKPKIICMVRDVRAIYSSMEKNFRKNPHKENHVQNPVKLVGTTLDKRIDLWADGLPVGIAMDRLKDIFQQGLDKHMLFVRYEDLMSNPKETMNRVYSYLGVDNFEHSFDNITQLTTEDDSVHGIYGDHTLREEFKMLPNDFEEILGIELSEKIKHTYQWFYNKFYS
jgi:sulfotransferase